MVFEHPGLLDRRAAECTDEVCITCSDEGRVAEVSAVRRRRARPRSWSAAGPRRSTSAWSTRSRPATWSWSTPAWPSPRLGGGPADDAAEPTGFLYPFIEAEERDAAGSGGRPGRLGPGQDGREPRACGRPRSSAAPDVLGAGRRGHGRPLPRRRPAVRLRQRRQRHRRRRDGRLFRAPAERARRCRPCRWSTTGPCSPPWPTTSASSWSSPARSSPTPAPGDIAVGFSTSGDSRQRAPGLRGGVAPGAAHRRAVRLRGRRPWPRSDAVDHCLVVRSDSVHRIQETQDALMLRAVVDGAAPSRRRRGAVTDVAQDSRCDAGREAAVFERIEAFRRRRPRLLDEVVTLAHGAGGKASAALLDAVFLPAFANDALGRPDRRRRADPALGRAAGLQHRLLRGQAAALPRRLGRPPGRARHGQRPGHDGRPPAGPVGRLRARRGLPDRRRCARSSPTWPRRPRRPACRS